jgi:RecA-family ATPase
MRPPPPHNSAQSFLEDQERRTEEWRRHQGNGLSGERRQGETVQALIGMLSPATLEGKPVPARRWIVEGVAPVGNVVLLSGDGGLGKSLLAQQLMTCAAIGHPWLDLATVQCPSLGVFCEDDLAELHIRQAAINQHYGCSFADLKDCHWIPRVGQANVMMAFAADGRGSQTAFYRQICDLARRLNARLVVLDSLHDLFSGDENRRGAARQFVGALRSIVQPLDGVVLLLAHPSLSGLNSGTGAAGSTAWNNAARGRLYLTRADADPATEATNERVLKTMKSNYGPAGGKIRLRWEHGVFVRMDKSGSPSTLVDKLEVERIVVNGLQQLVANDTRVAADPSAKNGLANVVRALPTARHLSWQAVVAAQERLIATGGIVRVEMGPPSKRRVYLRTANALYPGEARERQLKLDENHDKAESK